VPVVQLLPRTSLLAGLTAYWRLQTSHRPIEMHRTVHLAVLVVRLMCQRVRLSVLIVMRLQTNLHLSALIAMRLQTTLHLFALIAMHLQTTLRLSDLTVWSHRRDHLRLAVVMGC
jgi:hypothetical protein